MPIRIASDTLPALVVGVLLVLFSIGMACFQVWNRRGLEPYLEGDLLAMTQADRQLRRRLQVSVMLGIIGLLIPVGDQLDWFFKDRPVLFVVFWVVVLFLVCWVVLMALADWLSTAAYSSLANIQLRRERREIEEEVRRYRAAQNGNSENGRENDFRESDGSA